MNKPVIFLLQQLLIIFQSILDRLAAQATPIASCPKCDTTAVNFSELYDKQEVMELLRISPRTYARYKSSGRIKTMRVGGRDYITPGSLKEALRESVRKGRV